MGGSQPTIKLVSLVRGAGLRVFLRKALEQTWWTKLFFGLRCDCDSLPPIRRAEIEITMKPWDSKTFPGFVEELQQVEGSDYVEVFLRQSLCDAGVETLHAALAPTDHRRTCSGWSRRINSISSTRIIRTATQH